MVLSTFCVLLLALVILPDSRALKWSWPAFFFISLPFFVTLNLLAIDLWVLILGIFGLLVDLPACRQAGLLVNWPSPAVVPHRGTKVGN